MVIKIHTKHTTENNYDFVMARLNRVIQITSVRNFIAGTDCNAKVYFQLEAIKAAYNVLIPLSSYDFKSILGVYQVHLPPTATSNHEIKYGNFKHNFYMALDEIEFFSSQTN